MRRGYSSSDRSVGDLRPPPVEPPVTLPEGITPDGARYAAHLIRKRSKGDRFHPRRPETAAAMLAAAEWLDQFAVPRVPSTSEGEGT